MNSRIKNLVYCALGACFISISAQLTFMVPISVVPITLQTLAVYIIGSVYDSKKAVNSCLVYLLLGAIGLPVFAGFSGGLATLFSPTGGYLISLPIMAFNISKLSNYKITGLIVGTIACYVLGTIWFMVLMQMPLWSSLLLCVFPFIPGDIIKMILSLFVTKRLKKV